MVTLTGPAGLATGSYLLRIRVSAHLRVTFGRFGTLDVPGGEYIYIGSAMGERGPSTLARRLLRHATRSDGSPQPVRPALSAAFGGVAPPQHKTPHWHIDYLLEEAALTDVLAVHSSTRLEDDLAAGVSALWGTFPLAAGLGASDSAGATHLLGLTGGNAGWNAALNLARALEPPTADAESGWR